MILNLNEAKLFLAITNQETDEAIKLIKAGGIRLNVMNSKGGDIYVPCYKSM